MTTILSIPTRTLQARYAALWLFETSLSAVSASNDAVSTALSDCFSIAARSKAIHPFAAQRACKAAG